jgi:hypothetical protein
MNKRLAISVAAFVGWLLITVIGSSSAAPHVSLDVDTARQTSRDVGKLRIPAKMTGESGDRDRLVRSGPA